MSLNVPKNSWWHNELTHLRNGTCKSYLSVVKVCKHRSIRISETFATVKPLFDAPVVLHRMILCIVKNVFAVPK